MYDNKFYFCKNREWAENRIITRIKSIKPHLFKNIILQKFSIEPNDPNIVSYIRNQILDAIKDNEIETEEYSEVDLTIEIVKNEKILTLTYRNFSMPIKTQKLPFFNTSPQSPFTRYKDCEVILLNYCRTIDNNLKISYLKDLLEVIVRDDEHLRSKCLDVLKKDHSSNKRYYLVTCENDRYGKYYNFVPFLTKEEATKYLKPNDFSENRGKYWHTTKTFIIESDNNGVFDMRDY